MLDSPGYFSSLNGDSPSGTSKGGILIQGAGPQG